MSGGLACTCKGDREERQRNWRVLDYKCNHSAFNGYRETPSDYSSVTCPACGAVWRTKGAYVAQLPSVDRMDFAMGKQEGLK